MVNKDEIIFSTTDPLGRKVVLYSSTWYGHIEKRDDIPEDMVEKLEEVKNTLENPYAIGKSFDNENREFYYAFDESYNKYTAVIVDFSQTPYFVVTTFKTQRLKCKPFIYINSIEYGTIIGKEENLEE
ncbi:hypothetical protein XO10_00460 [Marinitoga sp. 1135]|uniref:hypothetical protein n=1 Tax=Marinitoga sp. 1135 TaxID=1643333 RepID=UPI0015868B10|nr:hypothetical protein [Marinitoga sp. 1135]NUU94794.1 hypothetical protein [Marinitoga sp. 1135]